MPATVGREVNAWVRQLRADASAAISLICFPYAGGSASVYHSWSRQIGDGVDLYAIQLPGRGDRIGEAPIGVLDELLPQLGAAAMQLLTKPFALFGHSLGALLAFELSRWLRRERNILPQHLFVVTAPVRQGRGQ